MTAPVRPSACVAAAAAMALSLAVSGCAHHSTPYQPISSANRVAGGYSDIQISEDRYRVSFAGNRLTSREQVETYLLFRAAELTLEKGMDWFAIEDRVVEREVERQVRPDPLYDPWFGTYYGSWRPYWSYYGPRTGWRRWYPYYGHSFWTTHVDIREVERYEATAEIRVGSGAMPDGSVRAFNAREVVTRLGPRVEHPGDR
ncbi:CC0125/CC1285 family lipoprotein [Allopontixanthobacter confluentis]|nr:hypothetical protein [Allopontixanthobacter confluentis]